MRLLVGLALMFVLAACRRSELVPGVSDSAFVRAMAGLRRLPPASTGQASRDRARDSILRANGLTVAQFEAATLSLVSDPERAADLFRAVENRAAQPVPEMPIRSTEKKGGATK